MICFAIIRRTQSIIFSTLISFCDFWIFPVIKIQKIESLYDRIYKKSVNPELVNVKYDMVIEIRYYRNVHTVKDT